jgi:hypothetical protein
VRRREHVRAGEQRRRWVEGLLVEDVERGAAEPPLVERAQERGLADEAAARRVHQDRAGLHERERAVVDDLVRPLRHRHAQEEDVALREQGRQVLHAAEPGEPEAIP